MIISGPVSGGLCKSLRRAYQRQINSIPQEKYHRSENDNITFSKRNANGVKQPHDDPFIIMVEIEGFNIRRVLVDNGNSANIIYITANQ